MTKTGVEQVYKELRKRAVEDQQLRNSHLEITPNDIRRIVDWIEECNIFLLQAGERLCFQKQTNLIAMRTLLAKMIETYYHRQGKAKDYNVCEALIGLSLKHLKEVLTDADTHGLPYKELYGLYWIEK